MEKRRTTPFLTACVLALVVLGIAGCSGSNSVGPGGNTTTRVRGINALQECPGNVDIGQVGLQPTTASNLAYGVVPTNGYNVIRAGVGLHYAAYPAGQTTNAVTTGDVDLNPHDPNDPNSGTYTLVATGICNGGSGITTPHLVRLVDSYPTNFTGNKAGTVAIRVVNLIPDLNGGISLASNGALLNGTDNTATTNVPYAATSGYNGSHYNEGINLAGSPVLTIRTNANAVLATVASFNFQVNHAYTLFVFGEVNPTSGGHAIDVVPVLDF